MSARRIGGNTSIRRGEENQKRKRGQRREGLCQGKGHRAGFVTAAPTLENGAAYDDSSKESGQHQRERVRGAAELCREQARPADFIGHGRAADDCKTDQEKTRRQSRRECLVFRRKR